MQLAREVEANRVLGACAVTIAVVTASLLPAIANAAMANAAIKEAGSGPADPPGAGSGPAEPRDRDRDRADTAEPRPIRELVWTKAEVGVQSLHLRTFHANVDTVTWGILPASAAGPMLGLGAGVRIVFLTLGVRGRFSTFNTDAAGHNGGFQLWTLDAELGFRVPLGRFEPYITVAGGYATFGGLRTALSGLDRGLDVNGVNTRLALGLDYYVTKHLSFGASLGGDLLFITRHGVSARDLVTPKEVDTLNQAKARVLEADGSNVGAAWSASGGVGVHF